MFVFLKVMLQFTVMASDPHWACELAHRDPGVPATMYLYCAQTLPDGTEVASIGKFVPDAESTPAP